MPSNVPTSIPTIPTTAPTNVPTRFPTSIPTEGPPNDLNYDDEFEGYKSSSISTDGALNCYGFGSCGHISGNITAGESSWLRCSGGRACQQTGGEISGDRIRALGYMAVASSNKLEAYTAIDCLAEVTCFFFFFFFFFFAVCS